MKKILSLIIALLMVFNTSVMTIAAEEGYNDWSAKLPPNALDIDQNYIDSHKDELFNGENVVEDPNLRESVNFTYKRQGDLKNLDVTAEMMKHLIELSPEKCVAHNPGEKNFQVKSLKGLEYSKNLEWVSLVNQPIEDLSPLKDLTKIRLLDIRNNTEVKSFDFLKNLNNLEQIDIHGVSNADISNLVGKTKLRSLNAQSCKISDLTPIKDLKELRYLNLPYNKIDNIEPLKELTKLQYLDISNQFRFNYLTNQETPKINTLKPLEGLTELKELSFSSHNISDLTPLTKLKKLTKVTLTNNKIKDSEFEKLNSNIVIFGKDSQKVEEATVPEPKPEEKPETFTLKILSVNDKTEKTQQIYEKSYDYKDAPKLEQIKENLPKTVKAKLQSTQKTSNSLENLGYKEGVLRLLILDDNNKPVADNTELRLKPTVIFNPTITAKTKNGIVEFKDLVEKATYTLKHDVKEINENLQFTVKEGKLKEHYLLNKAGEITEKTFDYGEEIETKYFVGRIIDPANARLDPFEVKEDTTKSKEILENLEIEWDNSKPDYDQKEGTYIFEGKLKFEKNIENINDYKVIAKIIVNKEKQDENYNDWSAVMPKHSLDINQDYIDSHKDELFNGENVVEDANLRKTVNTLYHREGDATQNVTAEMMKHLIYLSPEECTCHNTSEIKVQIKSIKGLEYASNLEWISLVNQPIKDLSPLKDLTKIRYLDIRNNYEVKNFDFLKNLKNLEQADVHGTSLGSLANFADKTKLRSLHANSTNVSDLSPLKSLKELRYLSVAYNNIDNIEALKDLTNLRFLDISNQFRYNYVTDKETPKIDSLEPLEGLTELKELAFSSHNVSDLTPLTKLTKLEKVTLTNNKIKKSEFGKLNSKIIVFGKGSQEVEETTDPGTKPEEKHENFALKILSVNNKTDSQQRLIEKTYELKNAPKLEKVIAELPTKVTAQIEKNTQKSSLEDLGYSNGVLRLLILDKDNRPVEDNTELRLKPSLVFNHTITAKTKNGIVEFKDMMDQNTYTLDSVDGKIFNEVLKFSFKDGKLKEQYSLNKAGEITEKTFDYGEKLENKYLVARLINLDDKRLNPFEEGKPDIKKENINEDLTIEWEIDKPAYEQKIGAYMFKGTLKSDKNIKNINDFKVYAKVVVKNIIPWTELEPSNPIKKVWEIIRINDKKDLDQELLNKTYKLEDAPSLENLKNKLPSNIKVALARTAVEGKNGSISEEKNSEMQVDWDNGTPVYNQKLGTYIFKGTIKTDKKIANIDSVKLSAKVVVKNIIPWTELEPANPIEKVWKIIEINDKKDLDKELFNKTYKLEDAPSLENLKNKLPSNIKVALARTAVEGKNGSISEEKNSEMQVDWDNGTPVYNQKLGTYIFKGTIKTDKKIANIDSVKLSAKVVVKNIIPWTELEPGTTNPGTTTPSVPGTVTPSVPGTVTPSVPGTTTPSNPGTTTPSVPGTTTPAVPETTPDKPAETTKATARVAGTDRINTAVEVSKKYYKSAETVIIANSEKFADSLSASALSKALKAPILLVKKDQLDSVVAQEIKRLGAKNVVVIGGEQSVDEAKNSLSQYNLQTIAGSDRYETSAKIAQEIIKRTGTTQAVIASGETFADALTVAPLANKNNMPILLVQPNNIPKATQEVLKQIKNTIIVGGEKTISKEVENKLPNATRIAGANRYETAKKIYEYGFKDRTEVNIANGTNFADSLVIGSIDCPILLAESNEVPESTKQAIKDSKFEKVNVFGGENSIGESVVKELIK